MSPLSVESELPQVEEAALMTAEPIGPPLRIGGNSTRRNFFRAGAAVAVSSAGALALIPRRGPRNPTLDPILPPAQPSNTPTLGTETWGTPEIRLARRITMGLTPEEAQLARTKGFSGYLDYQLNYTAIDDTAVQAFVATTYPQIVMTGVELYLLDAGLVLRQLQEATLFRAAFSKRQLYERMVEFWSDHFNISMRDVGYLKTLDDRDVVRKHALGSFPDMVRASARSTAMLTYLDNNTSRVGRINENYARELMELHTLGVDGGYTQADVVAVARCFTGWTITGRGDFRFDAAGHDYAAKTFLGQAIPAAPGTGAAGISDGDKVIDYLVKHPNTAKYVSSKMIKWLLRYDPSPALVDQVAAVYMQTNGNIPAMIRSILTLDNIVAAPPKHKRPFHFVASALRAVNPTVKGVAGIAGTRLQLVGQQSFVWETPDGYPDNVQFWSGLVMQRWNFGDYLAALTTGDVIVDIAPLRTVDTPDGIVNAISTAMFGGAMPLRTRDALRSYLGATALSNTRVREALALAINSTSFQWY